VVGVRLSSTYCFSKTACLSRNCPAFGVSNSSPIWACFDLCVLKLRVRGRTYRLSSLGWPWCSLTAKRCFESFQSLQKSSFFSMCVPECRLCPTRYNLINGCKWLLGLSTVSFASSSACLVERLRSDFHCFARAKEIQFAGVLSHQGHWKYWNSFCSDNFHVHLATSFVLGKITTQPKAAGS
jgi:hypothetical protein